MSSEQAVSDLIDALVPSLIRAGLEVQTVPAQVKPGEHGRWFAGVALRAQPRLLELRAYAKAFVKQYGWKLEAVTMQNVFLVFTLSNPADSPVLARDVRKSERRAHRGQERSRSLTPSSTKSPTVVPRDPDFRAAFAPREDEDTWH